MIYVSFDKVSSVLLWKIIITIFGHMVSEILIFKVDVIKSIKIARFDENPRFYKILLEFDKISKKVIITSMVKIFITTHPKNVIYILFDRVLSVL